MRNWLLAAEREGDAEMQAAIFMSAADERKGR
jgi:hypothetical protein